MRHRRENDASGEDHRQTAIESEQARKELPARGDRHVYGAHSAQEHGCVQECIHPAQTLKDVVADHANEQRHRDEDDRDDPAVGQPDDELVRGNDGLGAMLKLWKYPFHGSPGETDT